MPDFAYTARRVSGEQVIGTLSAGSEREALALLGERELFPLRMEQQKAATARTLGGRKKVKPQLLATTLAQLSDLLNSGVPLLRSLDVLARQSSHATLSEVLADIRDRVSDGERLDQAFARHPAVFNELIVSMVRAGGEGGFLEDALSRTAQFVEQQEDLKSRVIGAATYPAILAIAGTTAVTVIIVFLVPKFGGMFAKLEARGELPGLTIGLLALSSFLGRYGLFLLAGLIGGVVGLRRWIRTPQGRLAFDRAKLKVPVAGPIYLNLAVARFCRVLGTLLHNGVPILKALDISSDSTGNKVLADRIKRAGENISSGERLAQPLGEGGLFPRSVVEMISVAEESNSLEKVLIDIANGTDRRTERQLDLAVRLMEPAMLMIMGVAILMVVTALLLPVMQMSTTMG